MTLNEFIVLLRESVDAREVDKHREEIAEVIPSIRRMFDFDQQNRAHQYDLWMHCLHTALGLPKDIDDDMLYLAAVLHDIGKPDCQVEGIKDGKVNMHYYGHPERSKEIVRDMVIPELIQRGERLSEDDRRRLIYYVEHHDDRMSLRIEHLEQHLNLGVSLVEFQNLMKLEVADAKAHIQFPIIARRIEVCSQLAGDYGTGLYQQIVEEREKVGL